MNETDNRLATHLRRPVGRKTKARRVTPTLVMEWLNGRIGAADVADILGTPSRYGGNIYVHILTGIRDLYRDKKLVIRKK